MNAKLLLNSLKSNPGFGYFSYDQLILDTLKSSSLTSENADPKILILCGPPGSGKSTIKNQLLLSKNITDYINIDPDEIRSILMNQGLTFPDDKTMSGITNAFNKRISDEAQKQRFNIVFDTTGQNFRAVFDLTQKSQERGYKTYFVIVYASLETCLGRVNTRNAYLAETGSTRIPLPRHVAESIYNGFTREKGTASMFLLDYPVRADEILLYDNNSDGEPKVLYQKIKDDVVVSSNFSNFYNMTLRETAPYIVKKRNGGKTKRARRKKSKKTRKYKKN